MIKATIRDSRSIYRKEIMPLVAHRLDKQLNHLFINLFRLFTF